MRNTNQDQHLVDKRRRPQLKSCTVVRDKSGRVVTVIYKALQRSPEAVQRSSFGTAEISAGVAPLPTSVPEVQSAKCGLTGEVSLGELIARCENLGGSKGFFGRRDDQIVEVFTLGYALLQCIVNDIQAIEDIRERLLQHARERKPPNKNVALLAMLFVCRPATEEQRKLCSDYASALIWAEHENVRAEDFARAWRSTTLTDCKEYVRDKRRAAKSETRDRQKEPYIEIRLGMRSSDVLVKLPICLHDYEALLRIKGDAATAVFHPLLYPDSVDRRGRCCTRFVLTEALRGKCLEYRTCATSARRTISCTRNFFADHRKASPCQKECNAPMISFPSWPNFKTSVANGAS